jgi:hypothetical protein
MNLWKYAAVMMTLYVLDLPSSYASETVAGRWAVEVSSCEGFAALGASPLVVSNYAVRWQGDTCRIGRMYKTGETIYIQALCWAETGEKSIPVSLHPHEGRLSVT